MGPLIPHLTLGSLVSSGYLLPGLIIFFLSFVVVVIVFSVVFLGSVSGRRSF